MTRNKHSIIDSLLYPIITEKATSVSTRGKSTCVSYVVGDRFTKPEIKEAFEKAFNVKVAKVNTLRRKGTVHDRTQLRRKAGKGLEKVAYITLKEGENFYLGEI